MSQCSKCGDKGYVEVHQPGYTHYETDAGEPCPSYHFECVPCTCNRIAALEAENARLTDELARAYRERDASIEDLATENARLTAELATTARMCEQHIQLWRADLVERDALATQLEQDKARLDCLLTWMTFTPEGQWGIEKYWDGPSAGTKLEALDAAIKEQR